MSQLEYPGKKKEQYMREDGNRSFTLPVSITFTLAQIVEIHDQLIAAMPSKTLDPEGGSHLVSLSTACRYYNDKFRLGVASLEISERHFLRIPMRIPGQTLWDTRVIDRICDQYSEFQQMPTSRLIKQMRADGWPNLIDPVPG